MDETGRSRAGEAVVLVADHQVDRAQPELGERELDPELGDLHRHARVLPRERDQRGDEQPPRRGLLTRRSDPAPHLVGERGEIGFRLLHGAQQDRGVPGEHPALIGEPHPAAGAVVYRERLSALRVTAVGTASVGVVAAVVLACGLSWPTLLVALGLPLYFVSRRAFGLDSTGAQFLELTAMLPFSVVVMTVHPSFGTVTAEPGLVAGPWTSTDSFVYLPI